MSPDRFAQHDRRYHEQDCLKSYMLTHETALARFMLDESDARGDLDDDLDEQDEDQSSGATRLSHSRPQHPPFPVNQTDAVPQGVPNAQYLRNKLSLQHHQETVNGFLEDLAKCQDAEGRKVRERTIAIWREKIVALESSISVAEGNQLRQEALKAQRAARSIGKPKRKHAHRRGKGGGGDSRPLVSASKKQTVSPVSKPAPVSKIVPWRAGQTPAATPSVAPPFPPSRFMPPPFPPPAFMPWPFTPPPGMFPYPFQMPPTLPLPGHPTALPQTQLTNTIFEADPVCLAADKFDTRVECVMDDLDDLRHKYRVTFQRFCYRTCDNQCVTLFPLAYWWVPLVPLFTHFLQSFHDNPSVRYWGSRLFGCGVHKKQLWDTVLFMDWTPDQFEQWLKKDLDASHTCAN